MTDKIESKGKTVEDAVNEALLQMGARKDEVRIEVLDKPKSGLFGILGGKQARVLVTRKKSRGGRGRQDYRDRNEDSVAHDLSDKDSSGRRRGGRGQRSQPAAKRDESGSNKNKNNKRRQTPGQESKSRDGDGGSGRRRRGGGRRNQPGQREQRGQNNRQAQPTAESREQAPKPQSRSSRSRRAQGQNKQDQPARNRQQESQNQTEQRARPDRQPRSDRQPRPGRTERPERSDRGDNRDRSRQDNHQGAGSSRERNTAPDEIVLTGIKGTKYADPLRGVAEENIDQTLMDLTNNMLLRAGFPIRCEVKPGEYRQVRITTDDASAGMLIGRHGAAVDSIEHLVDRMVGMAAGERVRMNLDINNYRRRREESLHERVVEASAVVLENGRTYHMEPMCARERRIVHLQAETQDGIRTFTMGGVGGKHVVLAPENGEAEEKAEVQAEAPAETGSETEIETAAVVENEFDEFDDGPQPETNELVVDSDDDPRPLI